MPNIFRPTIVSHTAKCLGLETNAFELSIFSYSIKIEIAKVLTQYFVESLTGFI